MTRVGVLKKPKNDTTHDINDLLEEAIGNVIDHSSVSSHGEDAQQDCEVIPIETHGFWHGPLDEVVLAVLLDHTTLQKYKKKRVGYVPDGIPDDISGWELSQTLTPQQFCYVEKGNTIYLTLH